MENRERVLNFLRSKPRSTAGEIANGLGSYREGVSHHLQRLLKENQVIREEARRPNGWGRPQRVYCYSLNTQREGEGKVMK